MNEFELLFGVKETEIKPVCLLMPFITSEQLKYFSNAKKANGQLYTVLNLDNLSIIRTGIGAAFCADAVLHLKNTSACNLVLFGSCGLVRKTFCLDIGSVVRVKKSYNLESFSDLLKNKNPRPCGYEADKDMLNTFSAINGLQTKEVTGATFGSLKLEENFLNFLIEKKIEVADMESSAFFSAARYIQRKAVAILYVTDIIKTQPFYQKQKHLSPLINELTKKLCEMLKTYTPV